MEAKIYSRAFWDTPTHTASSLAEQHILCYCQCPWPLLTKHGICLAYGSSVGSSRQARCHPLPSATQTPSKHGVFFSLSPFIILLFIFSSSFLSSSFFWQFCTIPPLSCPSFLLTLPVYCICFPWRETFLSFATLSRLQMSFASVCVINEPLCLPTGANRKAVKEGSGTRIRGAIKILKAVIIGVKMHTDWLLCYTELKWAEQCEMRASHKRHPPNQSKEAHCSSNMAAYHLCILCFSALD